MAHQRATDNPYRFIRQRERVQLGVIAGPSIETMSLSALFEMSKDIAVRIENTDRGHVSGG